ncbi:MAG: phosphate--acyl-ACP acyltransferase [Myxococcales bacterium]|nr:phosphate--acyl-ACP acyltransferase [Myxococcales bacterium]|tara:strand:- start:15 stop:1067 length:1053 start_codon:yes stop_codon:yes gene_type:complete
MNDNSSPLCRVALDAMGGDFAPDCNIKGAIAAIDQFGVDVILVGDEDLIRARCTALKADGKLAEKRLRIRHAPEVVTMDEKPANAVRKKKASSMRIACELVKNGEADSVLSAGNSGAMMAIALFVFGRIDGVMRPAIGAVVPTLSEWGTGILVDAGANTECEPSYLQQFALMGHAYLKCVFNIDTPRIGVLSNGEEESKGNELTQNTLALLQESPLKVIGYCEGGDLFKGTVDVAVCDGFTGNVALKAAEGSAKMVMGQIKRGYAAKGWLAKLGGLLSKPAFAHALDQVDPRKVGAAPLLGVNHPAFIAHGNSDDVAIAYSIQKALLLHRSHGVSQMRQMIQDNARAEAS